MKEKLTRGRSGVKGGLQGRTLYFLFSELNQSLILQKAELEMEGMQVDRIRCFCLPKLQMAGHKVLHERVINRQRVQLDPAVLQPGALILLILNEKLYFAWSKVLHI